MTPFSARAEQMGLETNIGRGLFSYRDRYSEVVYRQLVTMGGNPNTHETDNIISPLIAVFTRKDHEDEFQYCGYVSDGYQFIGNEFLVNRAQEAITAVGNPTIQENVIQTYNLNRLRSENIIQNGQSIPRVGDVLPVIIIENSYNGTRAAISSFGIAIRQGNNYLVFSFQLGTMRQVHIETSSTSMTTIVSGYMQVFSENIVELISNSFESRLSEDDMFGLLDLIESHGKKRREKISDLLKEINPPLQEGQNPPLPTAWQMFLAIVRYSSFEPNLNIKKLLENTAESVLVVPARMRDVLQQIQNI